LPGTFVLPASGAHQRQALRRPGCRDAERAPMRGRTPWKPILGYSFRIEHVSRYGRPVIRETGKTADVSLHLVFRFGNVRIRFSGAVRRSAAPANPRCKPYGSLVILWRARIVTESPFRTATEKTLSDILLTRKYSARADKKR
jgi:hypothetical protein